LPRPDSMLQVAGHSRRRNGGLSALGRAHR
jgi:hypothetical protein